MSESPVDGDFILLSLELKYKIFDYIQPCILLRFKRLNRNFYNNIQKYIKRKFDTSSIFTQFFLSKSDVSTLYDILDRYCILSGSSILKFLLDDTFPVNNLNIYSIIDNCDLLTYFLKDNGYEDNHNFYNDEDVTIKEYYCSENKKTIQIVLCEDPLFIVKHFDFSSLKNYYDGKNFVYTKPDLESKREVMTSKEFFLCSRDRVYKYLGRDFEILTQPFLL
jgi:hypothetical protein